MGVGANPRNFLEPTVPIPSATDSDIVQFQAQYVMACVLTLLAKKGYRRRGCSPKPAPSYYEREQSGCEIPQYLFDLFDDRTLLPAK
jgi:hypothetical protein